MIFFVILINYLSEKYLSLYLHVNGFPRSLCKFYQIKNLRKEKLGTMEGGSCFGRPQRRCPQQNLCLLRNINYACFIHFEYLTHSQEYWSVSLCCLSFLSFSLYTRHKQAFYISWKVSNPN